MFKWTKQNEQKISTKLKSGKFLPCLNLLESNQFLLNNQTFISEDTELKAFSHRNLAVQKLTCLQC